MEDVRYNLKQRCLASFLTCSAEEPERFAYRCWYCSNIDHIVRCFRCRIELGKCTDPELADVHHFCSPYNTFDFSPSVPGEFNVIDEQSFRWTPPPKYPDFSIMNWREVSIYHHWPVAMAFSFAEILASAGFFATGQSREHLTCFHCGIVLGEWELTEGSTSKGSPFVRHCLESPTCVFMINIMGKRFICDAIASFGSAKSQFGFECKNVYFGRYHQNHEFCCCSVQNHEKASS